MLSSGGDSGHPCLKVSTHILNSHWQFSSLLYYPVDNNFFPTDKNIIIIIILLISLSLFSQILPGELYHHSA